MTRKKLQEGDVNSQDLPCPGNLKLIERYQFGRHTLTVQDKKGSMKSRVDVADFPHWEAAFDRVMRKAGV